MFILGLQGFSHDVLVNECVCIVRIEYECRLTEDDVEFYLDCFVNQTRIVHESLYSKQ